MKKLLYLFLGLFLCCLTSVDAQDLIVKTNNDSIQCKVIKQNSETVFYFTYTSGKEVINAIKKTELKEIKIDYYTKPATDTSNKPVATKTNFSTNKLKTPFPGKRFGINCSASKIIARTPSGLNQEIYNYINELKTGNSISLSFNNYGKRNSGLGIQYMYFFSSNALKDIKVVVNNTPIITSISDNITMQYFGLSYGVRNLVNNNNKKLFAVGDFGFGYNYYKNEATILAPLTITANSIALNSQIGLDYLVSNNICIGVLLTFVSATVGQYTYDDGFNKRKIKLGSDDRESHSRAEISLGIRYVIE